MQRPHRRLGLTGAALIVAGLASGGAGAPALAQMPQINMMPELKSQTPEEKERDAQADKAYRESLRKIPNQSANDPWGDVRGAGAAKPATPKAAPKATQAKRQTKTDGTAN